MKKSLLFVSALLFTFALSTAGGDQDGDHGFPHKKLIKKLGLDSNQSATITAHFSASKGKMDAQRTKIEGIRTKLDAAFATFPVDKNVIGKLKEEKATAKAEMIRMHIDSKLFLVSQLNAEQHGKYLEFMQKKKDRKDHKKGGKKEKK